MRFIGWTSCAVIFSGGLVILGSVAGLSTERKVQIIHADILHGLEDAHIPLSLQLMPV